MIPRQLFYSILSPISGSLVIVPFSILDTILVIFIESWIFPVLDASSALHALTSILFRLSRLSLFYLNFLRPCTFLIALNLSFIMTSKYMWLLFLSAHLYVQASIADLFHLLLSMMRSIWFFVNLSCEN